MKFILPIKSTGFFPEAVYTLAKLGDNDVHHDALNLSHPADMFLLAFNDVVECIYRLAVRVNVESNRRRDNVIYTPEDLDEIRIDIFNLIFFGANFVEACQSIIKSLFPKNGKDKEFNRASQDFKKITSGYREHVSKAINEIKHKHRRLRPFTYSWTDQIIIGYYLEGLVGKNILGPDPIMHLDFNGTRTGISLNRDLPFHLINLYFVSACLNSTIVKYAKISDLKIGLLDGSRIKECLNEVAAIPNILLPDELRKIIPAIQTRDNCSSFHLEFPSKKPVCNTKPHIADIHASTTMGIKNLSFAPPYLLATEDGEQYLA